MEKLDGERGGRRCVCAARTTLPRCNASIIVKNGVPTSMRKHCHAPPTSHIKQSANKAIKLLSTKNLHMTPRAILNKTYKEAAILIKPHSAKNLIASARAAIIPSLPIIMEDLIKIEARIPTELRLCIHGHLRSDENKIGVVFTNNKLLGAIGKHKTHGLYIDGTFDIRRLTTICSPKHAD
ncbi:hypothetical protein PV327_004143 [Microctonus hyperodae]|uniref:Uncharacterized protein n=1 Tax=Microctonus hyperodae TaxID=165561 RepID=A0AA39FC27_MICHY|nr:hypothetical protein PV327_004143 [Microctonus hyperodae]